MMDVTYGTSRRIQFWMGGEVPSQRKMSRPPRRHEERCIQGIFGNGIGVGNGVYDGTKIMGRMAKELALGIRCFPTFTSTALYSTV